MLSFVFRTNEVCATWSLTTALEPENDTVDKPGVLVLDNDTKNRQDICRWTTPGIQRENVLQLSLSGFKAQDPWTWLVPDAHHLRLQVGLAHFLVSDEDDDNDDSDDWGDEYTPQFMQILIEIASEFTFRFAGDAF